MRTSLRQLGLAMCAAFAFFFAYRYSLRDHENDRTIRRARKQNRALELRLSTVLAKAEGHSSQIADLTGEAARIRQQLAEGRAALAAKEERASGLETRLGDAAAKRAHQLAHGVRGVGLLPQLGARGRLGGAQREAEERAGKRRRHVAAK